MTTYILTGAFEQTRGVIGREPTGDEEYVFEFDEVRPRTIHMFGVTQPLRVEWYIGEDLEAAETLRPWFGWARHRADRVVERAAAIEDVEACADVPQDCGCIELAELLSERRRGRDEDADGRESRLV